MDFSIRRATGTDRDVIIDFNRRLAEETEDKQLSLVALRSGVLALLADPDMGVYFLAEIHNVVVGQVMLTYEWSDWRNGVFWWVQSVYVHPDFRRRGVFRGLYQHVLELAAQEKNVCGVRLYVDRHNERARKTYQELGMKLTDYRLMETEF